MILDNKITAESCRVSRGTCRSISVFAKVLQIRFSLLRSIWKKTHQSINNIKIYHAREKTATGYRVFYLFYKLFTNYGLIYIWHFSWASRRGDEVAHCLCKQGGAPGEEAREYTYPQVSAYWFYKNKNQFASSFHCGNLTKSKLKKNRVHVNTETSNWKSEIEVELILCSDAYFCCWKSKNSVIPPSKLQRFQLHGNMKNLFCQRVCIHKCIQSMGLEVSLGGGPTLQVLPTHFYLWIIIRPLCTEAK